MELVIKRFGELSAEELYEILSLRAETFIAQQKIVYNDLDGLDYRATHVFIWILHKVKRRRARRPLLPICAYLIQVSYILNRRSAVYARAVRDAVLAANSYATPLPIWQKIPAP